MSENLKGQIVLVTGANGGLGTAVTKSLLGVGATVVGVARSTDAGHEGHTGFYPESADLTQPQKARDLVGRVAAQFERIDVLVHVMGGFAGGASVAETDDATWQNMMNINLNAAFYVLRAVVPVMRHAGRGRIIAIGSRQAVQPAAGVGAYSASKAALLSLVQTVAIENKDSNIRANVVLPGTMDTPANRVAMPNANFENWVQPSRVAELVIMLAGEVGSEITGTAIPIYGKEG